jgi:hypothetical protein
MSAFEIVLLGLVTAGFLGLIVYAAFYARSKEEAER